MYQILETIPISDEVSDLVQKLGNFYTEVDREGNEVEESDVDSRPFTRPFAQRTGNINDDNAALDKRIKEHNPRNALLLSWDAVISLSITPMTYFLTCLLSLDQLVSAFQMPTMEGKSLVFIAAELIDCLFVLCLSWF